MGGVGVTGDETGGWKTGKETGNASAMGGVGVTCDETGAGRLGKGLEMHRPWVE